MCAETANEPRKHNMMMIHVVLARDGPQYLPVGFANSVRTAQKMARVWGGESTTRQTHVGASHHPVTWVFAAMYERELYHVTCEEAEGVGYVCENPDLSLYRFPTDVFIEAFCSRRVEACIKGVKIKLSDGRNVSKSK